MDANPAVLLPEDLQPHVNCEIFFSGAKAIDPSYPYRPARVPRRSGARQDVTWTFYMSWIQVRSLRAPDSRVAVPGSVWLRERTGQEAVFLCSREGEWKAWLGWDGAVYSH